MNVPQQARNKQAAEASQPGSKEVSVNNEPEAREPFAALDPHPSRDHGYQVAASPHFLPAISVKAPLKTPTIAKAIAFARFHGARDNTVSGRLQPRRPAAHSVARAQQAERSTCAGLPCGSDAGGRYCEEAPSE